MISDSMRRLVKQVGISRLVLILVCGIAIIVLSFDKKETDSTLGLRKETKVLENEEYNNDELLEKTYDYIEKLETKTANYLSMVEGVGECRVFISCSKSYRKDVLKDLSENEEKTVMVSPESNTSIPFITSEIGPVVESIVVVAKGSDDGRIDTEIIETVMVLFGLEAHKIKVIKMA